MIQKFYKIENNKAQMGSGTPPDNTWIIYVSGQEPQELLDLLEVEINKQKNNDKIQEAKEYLKNTSWIWEKYNRNVLSLENMTREEFNLKYSKIIAKQEEYRISINILENDSK